MAVANEPGLRFLAGFKASKGLLVLLVALGLLSMHRRHLTPLELLLNREGWLAHHRHLHSAIIRAASHLNDSSLMLLAWAALAYAGARFIEAYGLWRQRTWAEWIALLSTRIYVPRELADLIRRPRPATFGLAATSLAVPPIWAGGATVPVPPKTYGFERLLFLNLDGSVVIMSIAPTSTEWDGLCS